MTARLEQFLYLLARDREPRILIEKMIGQTDHALATFTNTELAEWAQAQARKLAPPEPERVTHFTSGGAERGRVEGLSAPDNLCSCASTTDPACPTHGEHGRAIASDRTWGEAPSHSLGTDTTHARDPGPFKADGRNVVETVSGAVLARAQPLPSEHDGDVHVRAAAIAADLNVAHQCRAGAAGIGAAAPLVDLNEQLRIVEACMSIAPLRTIIAALRQHVGEQSADASLEGFSFDRDSPTLSAWLRANGWFRRPLAPTKRAEDAFVGAVCGYGTRREFAPKVLDQLRNAGLYLATAEELDPPVCRLQLPDGSVPGNAAEAAQAWYDAYEEQRQSDRGKVDLLSSTLAQCAKRFREYERLHSAKVGTYVPGRGEAEQAEWDRDARRKADDNRRMAEMCEAAIDGWWMTVPGRDPDTIAECIALVHALPGRGLGAVARRDVVAALTRHMGEHPPARSSGSSETGLPERAGGAAVGSEAAERSDCYGPGCDEFPISGEAASPQSWMLNVRVPGFHAEGDFVPVGPSVSFVSGRHDRGWPTHPADAFEALARHMGYDLDRDKLAEVRRHCDEPVRVYDPRPPFAGLRGMTVQASKTEGGYVPVDLGEFALVILEEVERRATRRQRRTL